MKGAKRATHSRTDQFSCQVRDLLSKDPKNKLEVKEHKDSGVYVKGLNAFVVKSVPELRNVLEVSSPAVVV
jgi:hypothetical protein